MNTQENQNTQDVKPTYIDNTKAFVSRDGEYLTHVLPGNVRIRKHVNYYKALLQIPFVPKKAEVSA
jgi:hypothetical protein